MKFIFFQDDEVIDPKEQKVRRILTLLLKVKNGTPPQRKNALRQLSDNARDFGNIYIRTKNTGQI